MKKRKSLLLAIILLLVTGCSCSKEEVKCPNDTPTINKEYTVVSTDYSELYSSTTKSVVMVRVQRKNDLSSVIATGSGVVAYQEGNYAYVYTNAHVLKNLTSDYEVEILFSDEAGFQTGESEIATVVGRDAYEDVAVLRINKSEKYKLATIGDSNSLEKGDFVYTIGSPLGKFNYTTSGNVSSTNVAIGFDSSKTGTITTSYFILTNAAINEGNSGGALFNDKGELVGITTLKYIDVYGMYGALPIKHFEKVAKYLFTSQGARYVRPTLNIDGLSIDEMGTRRDDYSISSNIKTGVYIRSSLEEKISSKSVITAINGKEIKSISDYNCELLKYNVGDTITLTIVSRDFISKRDVSVTLHA